MSEYIKRELDNYTFEDIYNVGEEYSKNVAINFERKKYTYQDINKSVNYYAQLLVDKGIKANDHVALIGMNSFNWLIAFFAIIKIGAVAVLINYMARHETIVELIKSTDCEYICYGRYIALAKQENEFDKLLKDTGISEDKTISMSHTILNFKKIIDKNDIKPFVSPLSKEEDSKRTSFIIFTTGTTAKPKAACLSQYSMMKIIYLNFAKLDPIFPQKIMCLLPMFHCFGLLVVNAFLAFKRTVYIDSLSDKFKIYKNFVRSKCGACASVGIIYDKLARAPFWWTHKARFLKYCIVGGGFTSEQEFKFLEQKYGKGKFMNGYGQTECSPMISLVYPGSPVSKQKKTVGVPMEGIELAFKDPATNEYVKDGEIGEILVKGYNVFNGYYKVVKDKQPFDKDGYLHTGDLGYLDKDGYLNLTGRLKDIIIRKGENISPREIEHELEKFKEFDKVRVFGFPSVDEGEFIIACVEMNKKSLLFNETKYLDKLKKTLPSIRIPSHIIYVNKFPLAPNGKLDEMQLREMCLIKLAKSLGEEALVRKTRKLMNKELQKKKRK